MDYTLNIVSKCHFSLYLNIRGLQTDPGKLIIGVVEIPGKVLDFFVSKRVRTLLMAVLCKIVCVRKCASDQGCCNVTVSLMFSNGEVLDVLLNRCNADVVYVM